MATRFVRSRPEKKNGPVALVSVWPSIEAMGVPKSVMAQKALCGAGFPGVSAETQMWSTCVRLADSDRVTGQAVCEPCAKTRAFRACPSYLAATERSPVIAAELVTCQGRFPDEVR